MKKTRWLYFFIVILLYVSSCNTYEELNTKPDVKDNTPLTKFVIGQWEGERQITDINGSYLQNYKIEFVDQNNLVFAMKTPYDGFKDKFRYQFIGNNVLSVENDRTKGGIWVVHRNKEKLLICIWSNDNCSEFTKSNSTATWLYLLPILSLLFFGMKKILLSKKATPT